MYLFCFPAAQKAEQRDSDVFNIASLLPIGCNCLLDDVSSRNYCY